MPIGIAIVAGALASVNPCGFPLLPAFLSLYVGADEESLPRASSRVAQGLMVGMLVTTGFLGVFLLIGIPISYGASQLTKSIPWSGLALGVLLLLAGMVVVAGRRLPFVRQPQFTAGRTRRARTIVAFGAAYAVCSMGCTLPVFLAVIGASLATAGPFEAATVFGAYALGMVTMLMALSLGAALLRDGLSRRLKRLLPYMHRIAGVMLVLSGVYLSYYWARVLWAPADALASDPFVGAVSRFATWVQRSAASGSGRVVVLVAGITVAAALAVALWRWTTPSPRHENSTQDDVPDLESARRS
ncbi:MAG: cytochrome c biogenesis CcdA family protein [Candidatus Limnocylindria bacterium]